MREWLVRTARRSAWAMSFVTVLAVLQPALTAFDPDLAGWRPDHRHIFLSAEAETGHDHPYDHVHEHIDEHAEPDGQATDVGTEAPSSPDVLFTLDTSVAGVALPVVFPPTLTPPASFEVDVTTAAATWHGVGVSPLVPPPRA